jgi:alpha-ketoglutarate-dependent taurine dioxygenase
MRGTIGEVMFSDSRLPLVVQAAAGARDLAGFAGEQSAQIRESVLAHGAVLFRGFDVADEASFDRFVCTVAKEKMSYSYGSTPRTQLGGNIYTATEYPNTLEIPLHNECSYQNVWPRTLAFCCVTKAAAGGQTPLADMSVVQGKLGSELVTEFAQRKVKYVRHYRPYVDVPWQTVFGTDDGEQLARMCREQAIVHTWIEPELLRTEQVCEAVQPHRGIGSEVFFNQAHLFHVSRLGKEAAESLVEIFGEAYLPRNSYFGDGACIPEDFIRTIKEAFQTSAVEFDWEQGDVLLLDNLQVAHGRRAFDGKRRVLAALMDPDSQALRGAATRSGERGGDR